MIKDPKDRLYVGITDNPERRLEEHNNNRGSAYTKSGHFSIVFLEKHSNLLEARQRENQIKNWRREKKQTLIARYRTGLPTKP